MLARLLIVKNKVSLPAAKSKAYVARPRGVPAGRGQSRGSGPSRPAGKKTKKVPPLPQAWPPQEGTLEAPAGGARLQRQTSRPVGSRPKLERDTRQRGLYGFLGRIIKQWGGPQRQKGASSLEMTYHTSGPCTWHAGGHWPPCHSSLAAQKQDMLPDS